MRFLRSLTLKGAEAQLVAQQPRWQVRYLEDGAWVVDSDHERINPARARAEEIAVKMNTETRVVLVLS